MTRSIFDPDSGETERSGSRNLGADANQISQIPPDIVDGEVSEEEAAEVPDEESEEEYLLDMSEGDGSTDASGNPISGDPTPGDSTSAEPPAE